MDIPKLRDRFEGKVIAPGDEVFEATRQVFNGAINKKPAVIIQAKNADDVKEAIKLARETGLEFAVRSGGHSIYCTTDNGIVLDLRDMNHLEIDQKAQTAWVEPGMTAGEYSKETDKYDLVTGFGDTGSVGIGGITLGGGIGFLVRKYGMAIDNLLAAEIITADGQKLEVDANNHPDLFWAIRGGGGNFGVATRYKFKLHKLADAYGGMMIMPAEPDVLAGFMDLAEKAPEELSVIVNVMSAPPMPFLPSTVHGKIIIFALMVYAGPPSEGEKVLAPFRALAKPLADMVKPMRYHEIFMPEDESYHPKVAQRNMFMNSVDSKLAKTIIERLQASDATLRAVQLRPLGGAMKRVAHDATAFAHRDGRIMVNIVAFYEGAEEHKVREDWVSEFKKAMDQGVKGAYVGFIDDDPSMLREVYPEATWQRLLSVKQKYDPENLFKLNHNVTLTAA